MKNDFIELLQKTLEDPSQVSAEQLKALVDETLKTVDLMKNQMESEDPITKEEALLDALQIKEMLEGQVSRLTATLGSDFTSELSEDDEFSFVKKLE